MFPQRNGLQSLARTLCVLIFQLLLTHFCQGQPRLIGPPQPIIANIGHDIILPCNLEPGQDLVAVTLEWKRSDLKPIFVHARRARQNLLHVQHPAYKERTSIPIDELKRGNISLKLSDVKPSDQGRYECFIPSLNVNSFVELVVASGAVSSPTIELGGIDRNIGGVVLQCESKGWYPEPEVFWLDGKGNVLSAGPTETVRGPDDLYTVSSRVTVEKRHSNSFTCRVQQKNINQTRETHFYVPDDFFELQSSSSAVTTGLAVSLAVCITFIFSVIFLLWKWRQKIIKIKISRRDETNGDKEEAQPLRKRENVEVNKHVSWNPYKWFKDEHQEVKKLTEEKQTLNKELEDKKKEIVSLSFQLETKQTELQQLREEKERNENELKKEVENKIKELTEEKQKLNNELENKRTEVKKLTEEKKTNDEKQQQLQNELQTLKEKLESKNEELETKQTELQQLRGEKERNEDKLKKEVENKIKEFEKNLSKVQQELQKEKAKINEPAVFEVSDLQNTLEVSQAQGSTSSACQDSATVFIVDKVDPDGEYVQLRNTSHEDQQVGMGWELHVRVNRKPIILTFENSLVFKAKDFTQISMKQKSWNTGDRLLIDLYSDTGEMRLRQMLEIGHDPVTGHIIVDEVDPEGKYVRLKNKSDKEQHMKDWELHIQVDNRKPIIYTFDSKFKLNPGQTVTIWSKKFRVTSNPPTNLVSFESWSSGDQLLVTLYSNTREQVSMKKVDNTNV